MQRSEQVLSRQAPSRIYVGLFLVTLSTLAFEILLTRIFSVTMWYHFAFAAVSLAMFGMSAGALAVFLWPGRFRSDRLDSLMASSALAFAWLMALAVLIHLALPVGAVSGVGEALVLAATYLVTALPFTASGVAVCLALTRTGAPVGRLYAADLAGAGLGCVLLIWLVDWTDGISSVFVLGAVAALSGCAFVASAPGRLRRLAWTSAALLVLLAATNAVLARKGASPLAIRWAKGNPQERPLYEKWNSFSRIAVGQAPDTPIGWGLSKRIHFRDRIEQYWLRIDSWAGTLLTRFDGDFSKVEFLKADITNLAHYLRPEGKVLVVGVGGGRDVLSALAFGQREVLGVEINEDILDLLSGRYGEFTGWLPRYPAVRLVADEARSYVARQSERYDLIHVNFIDTWAATAAGAFVLTENSLYTVETWRIFVEHLTPTGILTVSRGNLPGRQHHTYRMTALARAALLATKAERPADHLAVVREKAGSGGYSMANLIVGRSPLSPETVATLAREAERLGFELALAPGRSSDPTLEELAAAGAGRVGERLRLKLDPPTDDSPFFFQMLHLGEALRAGLSKETGGDPNLKAVGVLGILLGVVVLLTSGFLLLPLALRSRRRELTGAGFLLVYFTAIGLGFLLVEISQMQRLIVFLGHPTFGLSTILFSLLLAGGLGSFLVEQVHEKRVPNSGAWLLAGLLGALTCFGLATPPMIRVFTSSTTPVRIAVAVCLLVPLGLFLGMGFPLGMRLAARRFRSLTPWFWGVNGAASVLASVAAVATALAWGITATYWLASSCYAVAFLAFILAARRTEQKVA